MCNDFRLRVPLDDLRGGFPGLETPGGAPNLEPREDVRITGAAPVVRATTAGGRELVQPALLPRLLNAGVDRNVRGRPNTSDHAPVWIELA